MPKKGPGWHNERRRHSLARKGVRTVGYAENMRNIRKAKKMTNDLIHKMSYDEIKAYFRHQGQEQEFLVVFGTVSDWMVGPHQTESEARTAGARQVLKEHWSSYDNTEYENLKDFLAKYRWFNSNEDVHRIIHSVQRKDRTPRELKRCGCANCQAALKYLEVS